MQRVCEAAWMASGGVKPPVFTGEQPNGYPGIVQQGASAEVQALVNDVNQKRCHMYEDIARRNATKLDAVEMLASKTVIDNTEPGNFIRGPSGQLVKKAEGQYV